MVEIPADAADGSSVRLDGLGLQAFEPEVLEVGRVMALEVLVGY
jgi:hypothetical protein